MVGCGVRRKTRSDISVADGSAAICRKCSASLRPRLGAVGAHAVALPNTSVRPAPIRAPRRPWPRRCRPAVRTHTRASPPIARRISLLRGRESGRRRRAEAGEQLGFPRLGARQVRLLDMAEAADFERQARQFDGGCMVFRRQRRARFRRERLRIRRSGGARRGARRCGRKCRTRCRAAGAASPAARKAPSIHGP